MPKHLIVYLLCLVVLLLNSCQSAERTDHNDLLLKGQVKELRFKRYKAKKQGGEIIKERLFSRTLDKPHKYEYHRLPPNCKIYFSEDKNITEIQLFNGQGQLVYQKNYTDTTIHSYTADGHLIRQTIIDNRLRPNLVHVYNATGMLSNQIEFIYKDEEHLDCTHKEYNAAGKLLATATYQYNQKGLVVHVETHASGETNHHPLFRVEKIKYNKCKHPSEIIIDEGGIINVITIEYQLDEQHNWVQAVEYVNGQPERVLERELIYY